MGNVCSCNENIQKKELTTVQPQSKYDYDDSTIAPSSSGNKGKILIVDSYNALNNFFFNLKSIVKLQRCVKGFLIKLKKRKEEEYIVFAKAVNMNSRHSIISKNSSLGRLEYRNHVSFKQNYDDEKIEEPHIRDRKNTTCMSLNNTLISFEKENIDVSNI
jgi:hypothetical protein